MVRECMKAKGYAVQLETSSVVLERLSRADNSPMAQRLNRIERLARSCQSAVCGMHCAIPEALAQQRGRGIGPRWCATSLAPCRPAPERSDVEVRLVNDCEGRLG